MFVVVASAVNPLAIVAQLFTFKVQAVKFVMFQFEAVNCQLTVKSDSAVTFQLNVEVQLTANAAVSNELAVAVHRLDVVEVKLFTVAVVEFNVVIVQFVAVKFVAVTSHSKPHCPVIFPVKVTSPFTVWSVTLSNSKLG
ncbi:MAG: hypothetical protein J6T10_03850 [Methanobrevibacter sp.]|nr:hypothetical protein [Methanobrevibacter sp.]